MKATSIIWRRTFPDSAPGTDGVAIFDGRVIGRVRLTNTHGETALSLLIRQPIPQFSQVKLLQFCDG
jgi:hypothetical protein